jgi:hypothetical protein
VVRLGEGKTVKVKRKPNETASNNRSVLFNDNLRGDQPSEYGATIRFVTFVMLLGYYYAITLLLRY